MAPTGTGAAWEYKASTAEANKDILKLNKGTTAKPQNKYITIQTRNIHKQLLHKRTHTNKQGHPQAGAALRHAPPPRACGAMADQGSHDAECRGETRHLRGNTTTTTTAAAAATTTTNNNTNTNAKTNNQQ